MTFSSLTFAVGKSGRYIRGGRQVFATWLDHMFTYIPKASLHREPIYFEWQPLTLQKPYRCVAIRTHQTVYYHTARRWAGPTIWPSGKEGHIDFILKNNSVLSEIRLESIKIRQRWVVSESICACWCQTIIASYKWILISLRCLRAGEARWCMGGKVLLKQPLDLAIQ